MKNKSKRSISLSKITIKKNSTLFFFAIIFLSLVLKVHSNHNCLEQSELISVEDFRYKKVGYNTKNTFYVPKGGQC